MLNRLQIVLLFALSGIISGCTGGPVVVVESVPESVPAPVPEPEPVGSMVVLVPDLDGMTGAITVSNQAGSVDIASPNMATTVTNNTASPQSPVSLSRETIKSLFSEALSIQPKPPVHYILYFEKDLLLNSASAVLLPEIMNAIQERNSHDISVVGHADAVGSREYNMTLSTNRAKAVRDLLVQEGVVFDNIRTTSHGKENPLIQTDDNVSEPRNRRVEVVVR